MLHSLIICFEMFHMSLICSGTFHLPLICSNYSVLHLLWTDMFWNVLSAIDMLQLLYAPIVMNQICFEWHDTYDFVSNEMVSLRILVFCLTLWYLTRLKPFLLFWICFVTCWAVFGSLRCYINLSGQLVTLRDVWFGLRQWIAIQNYGQVLLVVMLLLYKHILYVMKCCWWIEMDILCKSVRRSLLFGISEC